MLFQTLPFLLFFILFFFVYAALQNRLRAQNVFLLISSYIFYGWWDIRFLTLIIGGTSFAFILGPAVAGYRIERRHLMMGLALALFGALISFAPDIRHSWKYLLLVLAIMLCTGFLASILNILPGNKRGKPALVIGIVANLTLLAFFKYFNFFADSFADIVNLLGWQLTWTTEYIALPLGISFFTFQKIAYLIDIRRKTFPVQRDILNFATFVAFFPQLIAGPIERPHNLAPQVESPRTITLTGLKEGAFLFVWGMYKKVVVADHMSPIVNDIFSRSSTASSGELIAGLAAFTFQIYGDFSGYTDMARGISKMLGFNLMLNFNLPYSSRTPSEFWTRWHISLSSWLRDYLYVSLGGNRRGGIITYRNLFLTMLLGGLWHGANWTFIAWGIFHGTILIIYRLLDVDRKIIPVVDGWMKTTPVLGLIANFWLVATMLTLTMIGWLFFRAPDMATVVAYLNGIVIFQDFHTEYWHELVIYCTPLVLVQCWQRWTNNLDFMNRGGFFLRFNVMLFLLLSLIFVAPPKSSDFIYFAF